MPNFALRLICRPEPCGGTHPWELYVRSLLPGLVRSAEPHSSESIFKSSTQQIRQIALQICQDETLNFATRAH